MKKYCQKEVVVSMKSVKGNVGEESRLEFSITESQRKLNTDNRMEINCVNINSNAAYSNQLNIYNDSIVPPLQTDICGSD